jgi:hypothetical protein
MKLAGSRLLLIAVAAGLMTAAASPAFAWVCTAKNARGATYTAVGIVPALVCERALVKCRANTAYARSCRVFSSHP